MSRKKGKFIVIDGTDGSGKATQTKLLVKRLKKEGYKVKTIDFPRYYNNFFGQFIGKCLAGEFGDFAHFNPYIVSVLYAADRSESGPQMRKWISEGNIVIADRYASSNQIHQGGKIGDEKERRNFLKWIEEMEFEVFKIPKPDAIVYLDVPLAITQKLLKGKEKTKKKRYLNGKKDQHENDPVHLHNAKQSAIDIIKKKHNWIKINCEHKASKSGLKSKEEISDIIWKKLNLRK